MDYFSAHADQKGLLDYLKLSPSKKLKNIFLVHGEAEQSLPLKIYSPLRAIFVVYILVFITQRDVIVAIMVPSINGKIT